MPPSKESSSPIRVRVGAKQTVQVRPYESVVVEMSIELDVGTSQKELMEAVQNADVVYTLIREKVAARAFEVRTSEGTSPVAASSVGGREWTGRAAPPGSRGNSVKKSGG